VGQISRSDLLKALAGKTGSDPRSVLSYLANRLSDDAFFVRRERCKVCGYIGCCPSVHGTRSIGAGIKAEPRPFQPLHGHGPDWPAFSPTPRRKTSASTPPRPAPPRRLFPARAGQLYNLDGKGGIGAHCWPASAPHVPRQAGDALNRPLW